MAGIPALMIGAWAWGDRRYWGYGAPGLGPSQVIDAFMAATDAGLDFIDTAEVYGDGESEKIIGWLAHKSERPVRVATKFGLLPGRPGARALRKALAQSLARLRRPRVELYQIHWPDRAMASVDELVEALCEAHGEGLCDEVGVSNFSADEMKQAHEGLQKRGLRLASNQVKYSLTHRAPEHNGVLDACRETGAALLAYSPLDQGALSGRYHGASPPPAIRGREPWFSPQSLEATRPLVEALRSVGGLHKKSASQVALRWLTARPGVTPVVGVTSADQAREAASALTFDLSPADLERIEAALPR